MAEIKKIYNNAGEQIYGQTHERAVVDNNGTTAETKFQMITDLVQQAQMEIGAVPSDLTPTEDSEHWVTSGGIKQYVDGKSAIVDGQVGTYENDIQFVDGNGNVLAKINEDGIKTKGFDTSIFKEKDIAFTVDGKEDEVAIIDEDQNILCVISKDGIKTKNSDSSYIKGTITLSNADVITVLGSSFGSTSPFPTNKHWSGIMSMFSDYRIQNLSNDGLNIVSTLYRLRKGTWKIQGKYVAITNTENITTLNVSEYIKALDNLCSTIISLGKIPIVCTNYHKSQYFSLAIKHYAEKHGLMFWDAANYCNTIVGARYSTFDDGAHLRKRNAPMVAYAYLNYMDKMRNPYTSIKIFDIRDANYSGNLDGLVYSDNYRRAKLFKEIVISSIENNDEYNKIIGKTAVDFGKYGLVECIMPATAKDLKEIKLNLDTNGKDVKVYVRNTISSPYPDTSQSSSVRFSIEDNVNVPSVGDVYSSGGVDYTVLSVVLGENNYYCTIYCSPATLPSSQSGTLSMESQMSGSTGASSIDFVMAEEATLDMNSYIDSDNKGHWVELENDNNSFVVPSNLFDGSINIDKACFLIESNEVSETFQIKDISVEYVAAKYKEACTNKDFVWDENDYIYNEELIEEPTFGNIGTTLSHWTNASGNAITSVANYEKSVGNVMRFPSNAKSEIVVSDSLSMNTTVPYSSLNKAGTLYLEIYCRYFPTAPNPYTQVTDTEVNDNSYDFNTLFVRLSSTLDLTAQDVITLQEEVGLYWKIVRIPVYWFWQSSPNRDLYISLSSNNKGIEICKVSLKYK